MANIEITTAHNVVLQYPLASLGERVVAYVIDAALIMVYFYAVLVIMNPLVRSDMLVYLILMPISFYTFLFEMAWHGRTPGKRMMGLRVVKITGEEPTVSDYFQRWTFRLLEIYATAGTLAAVMVGTTSKHQRLGGMLSDTAVIKSNLPSRYTLDDLVKLNKDSDKEVVYPEVAQFNEEQMLMVKRLLIRFNRHQNSTYSELIHQTVDRIAGEMGIDRKTLKVKDVDFLKQVIRDYVLITRS
jgi:uncharacterized RDD family membrane protein YckC